MSPVTELNEVVVRGEAGNGAEKEGGEEQGDDVVFLLSLFFCHAVISDQFRDKTLHISQKAGRRAMVLIYVDTGAQSWVLIIYLKGAHQHLIHFVGLLHFPVFVCASQKSVCLLKSFIYIHRHFLDALN